MDYNDLVDEGLITQNLVFWVQNLGFESFDVTEVTYIQKTK